MGLLEFFQRKPIKPSSVTGVPDNYYIDFPLQEHIINSASDVNLFEHFVVNE